MQKCPAEECKDIEELKTEIFPEPYGLKPRLKQVGICVEGIKKSKWPPRVYIGSLVTVCIIIIGTFVGVWSDTRGIAADREKAAEREERVTRLEEKQKIIMESIKEIKTSQKTIADNTEDIKSLLRNMNP